MITGINESLALTKHISRECKCKFDGKKHNPNQWWRNDNVNVNKFLYVKKIMFGYETIRKDLNIFSVNPLYLIFGKVNGCFEETNRNKYLTLVPTNESKEKIKSMKNYGLKLET